MSSLSTTEVRSRIMSSIHSANTKPEIALRRALWKRGLRFRIHYGKERIDIAFPRAKFGVFVDGCFWHMCPMHCTLPKSNVEYWHPKLRRNVERDIEKDKRLTTAGWTIIHVWEHELENPGRVAIKIVRMLATTSHSSGLKEKSKVNCENRIAVPK
jgi:DNA mismatch endonuclease (patch repair protein)